MTEIARSPEELSVSVTARGAVSAHEAEYATQKVTSTLRLVETPILFSRLVVTRHADPAHPRPVELQIDVDLNGKPLRAHVGAHTVEEAADLLVQRLRDKLEHRHQRHLAQRALSREVAPGTWRHADRAAAQPHRVEIPMEERRLSAHKTLAPDELTPDEAAFDMEQLDYDFYLFVDLTSGEDALLVHGLDHAHELVRLHGSTAPLGPTATPIRLVDVAVPVLDVDAAVERLNVAHEPYVFFEDEATGRGAVVYRRYDGHHGMLTLAPTAARV